MQCLFFALLAQLRYRVNGGDATNSYAHSPPPEVPTFVSINEAYANWYKDQQGVEIDHYFVLPVLHDLQGHPESGQLWEEHINKILKALELGFKHMMHDHTIYFTTFKGECVLLL
jgi:hypothetical protein